MAKQKKGSKGEAQRRKEQSNRDKKKAISTTRNVAPRSVVRPKSKKPSKAPKVSLSKYAALVLNPCTAEFAQTNLPGAGGSQLVRLPFRTSYYLPTTSINAAGTSPGPASACDTAAFILAPHAMIPGTGPNSVTCCGAATEQSAFAVQNGYGFVYDSPGLSSLTSYVGEMRPVAACIRISCYSPDTMNSGMFFGYEGAAKQMITNITPTDKTTAFNVAQTAQNVIFNGMTSSDTFSTYEVRINYPNQDASWQTFRDMSRTSVAAGVYDSSDAADFDVSDMPIAIVGVTGGTAGCRYLVDGAIVYEWQPKLTIGVAAPKRQATASSSVLASTGRAVQAIANKWGGMLISSAVNYATGGGAGAVLSLARESYAASLQASKTPRIGWSG